MIATLEFDLKEQFDKEAHMRAVKSTEAYLALWKLQEVLIEMRNIQTDEEDLSKEQVIEKIIEEYHNILDYYTIDLDQELS